MLLLLQALAISTEKDITVCYKSCPKTVKGTYVLVYKADDVSRKIRPLLSENKNNVYLYNATKYIFSLDVELFQGYSIEFHKLVESSDISLELDCTESSQYAENFTFKNIDVKFYSSLKVPQLNLQNLEIQRSKIDLYSIDSKLVVETLISDKSIKTFSKVSVSKSSSSEKVGVTFNTGSETSIKAQVVDNGAIVNFDAETTTFSFDESLTRKSLILNEGTFCELDYRCSETSKLIQISINDIHTLHFVNSWPNAAAVDVVNSGETKLCANSTVLPVSIKSSSNSIITLTQTDTTIAGDVLSPVTFIDSIGKNNNRRTVTFSKSFSGSSLDLCSSLFDITIFNLTTDISNRFPFTFKLGKSGVSTLTALNCLQKSTQLSEIPLSMEFNSYNSEDELGGLLSKNWDILTLKGVNFMSNQIYLRLPTEPFIHGFVDDDSCLSSKIVGNKVVLIATPPSQIPLNICYESNDNSCKSVLTEENIDNLESMLPSASCSLKFIFGKQNVKPLNLDIQKIKGSTVFIQQENQDQLSIQMQLGNGIISFLSLNKIYGKVTDSSTFKIDKIELINGAKFDDYSRIGEINIDYSTVWKQNPIEPCSNNINLYLTDSSLTFTNDGFILDSGSKISSSSYPNLNIKLSESSTTILEASNDISGNKETTIYSETNHIFLGSNWVTKSSDSKVKIVFGKDVNTNDIQVTTKSFPFYSFPQLITARSIQIDSSVLPYEVQNDATFDNINWQLDFSHVKNQPEKAKVTFKSLEFKGSSSIMATNIPSSRLLSNENYPLVIENAEIADDSLITLSNVLFSNSLTINGNSMIMGSFEISNIVTMKWKMNKIPQIIYNSNANKLPQKIDFIFDEQSIDGHEKEYDDYLYGRSFDLIKIQTYSKCQNLKNVFNFISQNVNVFGSESVLDVECNNGNLIVSGARLILKSETKKSKSNSNTLIIVAVVVCVIAVLALVFLGVFLFLRKRRNPNVDPQSDYIANNNLLAY